MIENETEVVTGNLSELTFTNYEDLLEHCLRIEDIRSQMHEIERKANSIGKNLTDINSRVNDMYSNFENEIRTMKNVCETCLLVQNIRKFEQMKKLAENESNVIKKSQIIYQMECMTNEIKLEQIETLLANIEYVKMEKKQLESTANSDLLHGLAKYSTADVKKSILIFYNLNSLDEAICALENFFVHECEEKLKYVLNGKSGVAASGQIADNCTAEFWERLERTFEEELSVRFNQVEFFYKNLTDLNENTKPLYSNHYKNYLWKIFHEMCNCLMNNKHSTKSIIENEYPMLLQCYNKLFEKINLFLARNEYLSILADSCEQIYLNKITNKWQNKINSIFGKDFDLPSTNRIDEFVHLVARELVSAKPFQELTAKLETLLGKSMKTFREKVESKIINDMDIGQVIERTPTTNQQFNLKLANCLYYLKTEFEQKSIVLSECFRNSLKQLDELNSQIMQPLIASILTMIEKIILTIYYEKDWETLDVQNINTCSPYMKELTQFLNRIQKNYLSRFENKEVYRLKCNEIQRRTIELFMRHSTFLKPISKGGRCRLQYDYIYLEKLLRNIFGEPDNTNTSDDDRKIRETFTKMSTLVNSSAAEVARSELTASNPTLILFLLFSYADTSLAPPYHKRKWTIEKFSQWLDKSDEQQVLEVIWSTLKDYEESTRTASQDTVFRLMVDILETKNPEDN